jgi:Beta-lactamase
VTPIERWCDPAFRTVHSAFAANFSKRGELGAGCAVTVDGRVVVDIWDSSADAKRTRPWSRDTIVNVYSVRKPIVAVTVAARCSQSGRARLSRAPTCWPMGSLQRSPRWCSAWPPWGCSCMARATGSHSALINGLVNG